MRLADVLSKPLTDKFVQVEGFLGNQRLGIGKQKKIIVGKVALNFFCKNCIDDRTFCSNEKLFCIGVNDHLISIDCVLKCPLCNSSVQTWFLVECEEDIFSTAPEVRILKHSEKLSDRVLLSRDRYDDFSVLLEKAQRAYCEELGAGSIVYLRKILELITVQAAEAANINTKKSNGKRKPFKELLEEVDIQRSIIPKEFSANGYRLFGELSDMVHGDYDEQLGLQKYNALCRLIIGIIDNVKNNNEMMSAIGSLGWNDDGGTPK